MPGLKKSEIYAVDFDGVLCENEFPNIGDPNQEVIDYILEKQKEGATIILWTCRVGSDLVDAVEWCEEHDLAFDYVNENSKEVIEEFGTDTRKIYADYYIDDHNLPVEETHKKSEMEKWAENEVKVATEHTTGNDEADFNYISGCYYSALKAFKSLCNDGHCGMSFGITKSFLDRLMNNKPLTPIEDEDESWDLVIFGEYQCKRLSSLFKTKNGDGTYRFNDVERFHCYNENDDWGPYHSRLVDSILDELYPIEFPYYPSDLPYKVDCEEWLTDEKNGDFDTVGIIDVRKPDGTIDNLGLYFKSDYSDWEKISEEEYRNRILKHHEREDQKMDK